MIKDHVQTCRKLASLMEEKGVKWEWENRDYYILEEFAQPIIHVVNPEQGCRSASEMREFTGAIPIPTFTRWVEVLREWGWVFESLSRGPGEFTGPLFLTMHPVTKPQVYDVDLVVGVEAPDIDACGHAALVEAVRRMP